MEPHVKLLRQFRDRFLLTNAMGRTFVRLYYTYSPPISKFISGHEGLRMVVRWGLLPLVGMSWILLRFGFLPTTIFILLISTMISVSLILRLKYNPITHKNLCLPRLPNGIYFSVYSIGVKSYSLYFSGVICGLKN